jgi:hypothetical protein
VNAPQTVVDWTEANQRLLVAELARIKCLLRGDEAAAAQAETDVLRAAMPAPAAIDRVADRFGLSAFERDVLLLAAGVEMDAELGELCAAALPSRRAQASFGLALAVLPEAHWSALTPVRPLRRWRILDAGDDGGLVTARLRLDERVLHFLAGVDYLDARLQPLVRRIAPAAAIADAHRRAADAVAAALRDGEPPLPVVELAGDDPHGKQDVAATVAAGFGLAVYAIGCDEVPAAAHDVEALAALWEREAVLLEAALLVECNDAAPCAAARRLVERVHGLVVLATGEPTTLERTVIRHRIDKPPRAEQHRLWAEALGAAAAGADAAVQALAAQFRLSAREITRTGRAVAASRSGAIDDALHEACRQIERVRLEGLAQRIDSQACWDDLVLPAAQMERLREIAGHARHRLTVYEQWGFAAKGSRGLGLSVLFAGESGTGKTMAAEVLSNALGLQLFRIDLSAVVSKYIGETEKNLARVFDGAEDSGAVLLFDEADALFGKRSEVKDSHDRYANIEVSYLLQRMEAYRGLAILTSNQKAALDPAFQRRLRFVVHFPFPDAAERQAIWRRVFPAATPTRGLDFVKLARLHVAGGSIRNIALNAAFRAADAGEPVGMAHLLGAAHAEAAKRERMLTDSETRGWV